MEEEYTNYKLSATWFMQQNQEWVYREECYTYNGIKEKANEIKSMLEMGRFQAIYKKMSALVEGLLIELFVDFRFIVHLRWQNLRFVMHQQGV